MAIITDNAKLNNFINYMDTIGNSVVHSELYTGAIDAFNTGLKDFSITEQEQSLAFADFMAKTYLGQLDVISRTALAFDGEMAKVDKTKREISLVNETTVLTMEQINSERLRQQDTKANIALKNQQTAAAWESAKTEESRRLVLLKANNDNLKIKQSEHLVNYFKVVSDDEDVAITSENLHTSIKTNIEALDDNAIVISNTLPSGSNYIGDTEPIEIPNTITVRTESNILVVS